MASHVFASSTTLHTKSQMGRLSCRTVINNWPFVPFSPPSFLFSTSLTALSIIKSLVVVSIVFLTSSSLSPVLYAMSSFIWVLLSSSPLTPILLYSQVIVETRCPTFTETAPFLAIP